MNNLHIKVGDTVVLLTGDDKDCGKTGKVLEVSPKEGKVIVEGINMVKKHAKPKKAGDPSGIIDVPSPVYASKVQLYCSKCKAGRRAKFNVDENGNKTRVCAKCGENI